MKQAGKLGLVTQVCDSQVFVRLRKENYMFNAASTIGDIFSQN